MILATKDIPNRRKTRTRHVTHQVHRNMPRLHRRTVTTRTHKRNTVDMQRLFQNILENANQLVRRNRANRMAIDGKRSNRCVVGDIDQCILREINRDRLAGNTRHRKQPHQCTLECTDGAGDTLGDVLEYIQWDHMPCLVTQQLRLKNRDTQLKLRGCKLCHHPGSQACTNPLIHAR